MMEETTEIGDQVLVEATLLAGRKGNLLLVRIAGHKTAIVVSMDNVYRPSGERYILTVTDFTPGLPGLARSIRQLRQSRNMTQYDFSVAVGVSQQVVGLWETGKSGISVRSARRIAAALNIEVSEVLGEAA